MSKQLIIHATSSLGVLKSILRSSSLRLSYCKEDFRMGPRSVSSAAHPMVCFCQYDADELARKTITYGSYGIAFSTDWALRKGISPVLYVDGNSLAAKGLATLLKARRNRASSTLPGRLRLAIIEIKCFTKNVRGYNEYLGRRDFDFSQENEWRYVPRKSDIGGNLISQNRRAYLKNPDRHNAKLLPYPLKFRASDIEVIFVAERPEIADISDELSIKSNTIQVSSWKT